MPRNTRLKSENEAIKVSNLRPDFKRGPLLAAGMDSNVLVVLVRAVGKINQSILASNTRMIRTISGRAKNNLRNSILRRGESGQGADDRNRQTQKFTFGSGGAFTGVTGNTKRPTNGVNEVAFGFPNIQVADRKTKGIWRVLEFGLGNRLGRPQGGLGSTIGDRLVSQFGSKGRAMLPQKFGFTSPNPAVAQLVVIKGPAVSSGAQYVQLFKTKGRRKNVSKKKRVDPQGQFGKFFITRAVEDSLDDVLREYRQVPTKAYRKS